MLKKLREEEEEDEDREVKEMVAIKDVTDLLHYCKPCRTGLMSGKYMARHFYSAGHKEKKDPPDWRKLFDLSFLFEFGNLYKCLYCNTGLMNLRLMELHVGTADHRERVENCLNKEDLFDLHLPADNFVEAAFTLKMHADLLGWTNRSLHADLRWVRAQGD